MKTELRRLLAVCGAYCMFAVMAMAAPRTVYLLRDGWHFTRQDETSFALPETDDSRWQRVSVPHDWAINGSFDVNNDKQFMAIEQDGQKEAQSQAGRTGGLPFVGAGWYRLTFEAPDFGPGKRAVLIFDGAMSHAQVYVNGQKAGCWPYGYNSFYFDVTRLLRAGSKNVLAVRLENLPESSRWYPGAGLYRNVHLVVSGEVGIKTWGTTVTTPVVRTRFARVEVRTELTLPEDVEPESVEMKTLLKDPSGKTVGEKSSRLSDYDEDVVCQDFVVDNPQLWDCDTPHLYMAETQVFYRGVQTDADTTRFGIRTIEVRPDEGFFLNGRKFVFHGTCNHHDLGPLGAAVNMSAIRYRLKLLKDMGSNAYRTSHNMPSPELVQACDEMGMLLMVETFDEWEKSKMANGYHKDYKKWVEKDLVNVVRRYRNSPSVVMWCLGNEVPDQGTAVGGKLCRMMQDIVHREDPTRPCTMGMDRVEAAINSHVAAVIDIPGFNYRSHKYEMAYEKLPQQVVLGTETASTVSSRGIYKFPVMRRSMAKYKDHQASSYDLEHCSWSDLPEDNFIRYETLPYDMGEFVWTGFDYLGEPTPYYSDWPSHSSLFGIIDLAYLPKDRYYLYRSLWNKKEETLHILPHWNWEGREGEVTPVFVYSSYPTVELFINGKSQGRRSKDTTVEMRTTENDVASRKLTRQTRYRLMWMDTRYEPGTVKAVAYDENGKKCMETEIRTAGEPYRLVLTSDKSVLNSGLRDEDLAFVTVSVADRNGVPCPDVTPQVEWTVKGDGYYKAGANGDPTCLEPFASRKMHLFSGKMTGIIAESGKPGKIKVVVKAKGLKTAELELTVK